MSDQDQQVMELSPDEVAEQALDSEGSGTNGSDHPTQEEMPFALVYGKAVTKLPQDLYIPPDALEVFLEAFEGPLDLLLYLIKKQNLDVLDIKVSSITEQYMGYVELMKSLNLELAAEYLVMAALLSEIKSRSLLPRPKDDEGEETDPRAELIRRLQEYERFKKAAEDIDELPRVGRDVFIANAKPPEFKKEVPHPDVEMKELLLALQDILVRADMFESHQVEKERLSTRERMSQVLDSLKGEGFVPFVQLFTFEEGRFGVVVTFLAVLELVKESLIELVQSESFAPIHVRARVEAMESEVAKALEQESMTGTNDVYVQDELAWDEQSKPDESEKNESDHRDSDIEAKENKVINEQLSGRE